MKSQKRDYKGLMGNQGEAEISSLAKKVMQKRVDDQLRKTPQGFLSIGDAILPKWSIVGTNYAIVKIKFIDKDGHLKEVESDVLVSGEEKKGKERKQSAKSTEEHSERKALANAINKAIKDGWDPIDKNGKLLGALNIPPSSEQLMEYKEALKNTDVILFTEREPCDTGEGNCSEFLEKLLSEKKHKIYHSVNCSENGDFKKIAGSARAQYYKNNSQIQALWMEENSKQYQDKIKKAQSNLGKIQSNVLSGSASRKRKETEEVREEDKDISRKKQKPDINDKKTSKTLKGQPLGKRMITIATSKWTVAKLPKKTLDDTALARSAPVQQDVAISKNWTVKPK